MKRATSLALMIAWVCVVGCGSSGNDGKPRGEPGVVDGGSLMADVAAGGDGPSQDEGETAFGTLVAALQPSPGITLASLAWTISNPGLLTADRTGSVDLTNSQTVEFVVGGLPAGNGYELSIRAVADPGSLACSGFASFSIQPNATTTVSLTALCLAAGDGGSTTGSVDIDSSVVIQAGCPTVSSLSASPSEVNVGGTVQLDATGVDGLGMASDVTLTWSITGGGDAGTFGALTGTSTTFTCTAPGLVKVTATATAPVADDGAAPTDSGGACPNSTATVNLICDGKKVSSLSVSPHAHVCALLGDSTVECWGANESGELGNGDTASSLVPVPVPNLTGVTRLVTGNTHTCALLSDGTVQCWGDASMLGAGAATPMDDCGLPCSKKPVPVEGLGDATAIVAGSTHTCALRVGGTVVCWGNNSSGELGDGTTTAQLAPVAVAAVTGVTALSAGDSDTCALLSDGTVECWGYNLSGQLGSGSTGPNNCSGYPCSLKPVTVVGLTGAKAIVSGGSHTCALMPDTTVECWGFNDVGEIGNGTKTNAMKPVPVKSLTGVASLASGIYHSCAVLRDGSVWCWGDDSHGDFCDGTMNSSTVPVAVPSLSGATAVSLGEYDTCALLPGGKVGCCGTNTQGQLGDGTASPSSTPVPVGL